MHLTHFETLANRETLEVRVVFKISDDEFVVVKFWDPIQAENCTCKWFKGSYQRVRSHWRSQETLEPDPELIGAALSVIHQAVRSLCCAL